MAKDWLVLYKLGVKESTYYSKKTMVKTLNDNIGDIPLSKIKAPMINQYLTSLLVDKNFTYAWAVQLKSLFSRIVKHAYKYHDINIIDILPLIDIPRVNYSEKNDFKYLEPKELDLVLDHLESKGKSKLKRMVLLQVNTGLRFGEMASLRYDQDINLESQTIIVRRTFDQNNRVFTSPKAGDERIIYFNDTVKSIIIDQIRFDKIKMLARGIDRDNKLLFKSIHGNPPSLSDYNAVLKKIKIPKKKITSHIFRHTFVSVAVQNGINKELIAKQVGHTDTNMIDRVYAHFTEGMKEQQREAMINFKII